MTRAIGSAQKRVELQNFDIRKQLLEYDDVMNQQREVVYSLRLFALEGGEELKAEARRMIERGAASARCDSSWPPPTRRRSTTGAALREALLMQYLVSAETSSTPAATPDMRRDRRSPPRPRAGAAFQRKLEYLADFGTSIGVAEVDRQVLSQVMLSVLDEKWKDHLYDLDQLRNAIQYRGWGQKDPLVEYKKEAFEMFEDLMRDIQATFTERFLKIQVTAEPPPAPPMPPPPPPPPPRPARRTTSSWDGAARTAPRPRAGAAAARDQFGRAASPAGRGRAGGGPERSVPLRVGQEVQEVPRGGEVTRAAPQLIWSAAYRGVPTPGA